MLLYGICTVSVDQTFVVTHTLLTGAYLGFFQGICTFLANLPPPPDLYPDPDPHQDFELDPDPDPHQNNADPQPWVQLSKDCCLIYNYNL